VDIGLTWDFQDREKVDLDATVVLMSETGATVDAVYYNQLVSECGSI
jgi:stress response protein SCP2